MSCTAKSIHKTPNSSDNIASIYIPLRRRLQMLSVIIWLTMIFSTTSLFLFLCSQFYLWGVIIIYLIYVLCDTTQEKGGRRSFWVRNWSLWKYMSEYFPIQIIKEKDLNPQSRYIFGYHPHGILSFGAVSMFATEGSGFSSLFPGITPHLMVLPTLFKLPFYRDLLLSMGFCSVSKKSCEYVLSSAPGSSITIVVGGAQEAMNAFPGTNDIILEKRLGFVKLAIEQQADLVPVFCFGETDLYQQYSIKSSSLLSTLQKKVKKWFGFTFPFFYARGIFNYDFGLLPFRKPIYCIVGKPVKVSRIKDGLAPTKEQIIAVQKEYISELTNIYNKYKNIYAKDRKQELQIIA